MVATRRLANKLFIKIFGSDAVFTTSLILVFLALTFIGILNHEMWRDELQAWLIARDSSSISNLFQNLRYEGHPGLWHLCLYFLSRFTHNPIVMQLFHLALATGVIYLFARFSPFTKLEKTLFTFGYFPFFEYSIISRSYVLGVLLIFCFCILFAKKQKSYLLTLIILSLLSNTSLYGFIIAITMAITLLFELFLDKNKNKIISNNKRELILGLIIFTLSILFVFVQVVPPSDSTFKNDLGALTRQENIATSNQDKLYSNLQNYTRPLAGTIQAIWKSYVPIPIFFKYNFWNTNLFVSFPKLGHPLTFLFSLGLLIFSIAWFWQKPIVLFLYIFGTFGILLFTYLIFVGSIRHQGHLFILFVASLWLYNSYNQQDLNKHFNRYSTKPFSKHRKRFFTILLLLHLVAGVFSFSMDLFNPFSASKETSEFIKNQQLATLPIAGHRSTVTSTLAGLLERKIFYPASEEWGSFVVLSDQKKKELENYEILGKVNQLIDRENSGILLVLSKPLDISKPDISIEKIAEFTKSIVADELYYLYLIQKT